MKDLFERASSYWVRYDKYECRKAADGNEYVIPTAGAAPEPCDPIKDAEDLVLDALNVGMLSMNRAGSAAIRRAVMEFVRRYGLLGLMTAIPTTPTFMDYDSVYLLKNQFVKDEIMVTQKYLDLFQPFEKLKVIKEGKESRWDISDRTMIALAMTFREKPMAQQMCFMREYGERYDWLVKQFKDWAFMFTSAYLYYRDHDALDENTLNLYRMGMAAFDGIAPSYHIELREIPTIVWDYHSLTLAIQMMLSFMLTDENHKMKICENCRKVFVANRPNALFCSPQCKNRHNAKKDK